MSARLDERSAPPRPPQRERVSQTSRWGVVEDIAFVGLIGFLLLAIVLALIGGLALTVFAVRCAWEAGA